VAPELETTRVDRWLCAVRLHSTRTAAAEACAAGHVRINGKSAKSSTAVRVGDQVRTRVGSRERIVEVTRIIDKRVGAAIAAECLIDHTPPAEPDEFSPSIFVRDRGMGRPTKRDRRDLDKLRRS
jgi:ribosome-associated heat shock protein Hsp15